MKNLTILHLNFLNVNSNENERNIWLQKYIKNNKFDIIFIHNLNLNYIIGVIFLLKYLNYNYKFKIINEKFELIISKYLIKNFKLIKLKNNLLNNILYCDILFNNKNFSICSTNINSNILEKDFLKIFDYFNQDNKIVIFSIFFNFQFLKPDFHTKFDSFYLSQNKELINKFTYNYKINKNILFNKNQNNYDKILLFGPFNIIKYETITHNIIFNNLNIFDHFPIKLKLYF